VLNHIVTNNEIFPKNPSIIIVNEEKEGNIKLAISILVMYVNWVSEDKNRYTFEVYKAGEFPAAEELKRGSSD